LSQRTEQDWLALARLEVEAEALLVRMVALEVDELPVWLASSVLAAAASVIAKLFTA
jgi:hypothetical protein